MNMKALLSGWTTPPPATDEIHIRKYSTTGDILSFKRCRRQYGYFGVRGFASATNTQRYFGTLVHDVLDRINRNYQASQVLPSHEHILQLIDEAHERLIRSGVRPYNSRAQRETAVKLIERFIELIGKRFFHHVRETEYRLERVLKTPVNRDYILTGVVDVLSGAVSHELGLPFSTMPNDIEIWDYKSGKRPDKKSEWRQLRDYEYQMLVYAGLYRQQTGAYPARAVLIFLGELGDDTTWERMQRNPAKAGDIATNLIMRAIYTVQPSDEYVRIAMRDFDETVEAIEHERSLLYKEQWSAPSADYLVDDATCEACDLRYNCSHFEHADSRRAWRERAEPL